MNDNSQDNHNIERNTFETNSGVPTSTVTETAFGAVSPQESILTNPEISLTNPELSGSVASKPAPTAQSGVMAQALQGSALSSPITIQPQQDAGASASAVAADDVDLIEKEWVEKAKNIVSKTFNDPYLQNKAFGNLRSEYMKKRFGKTLKTEE